ncbi:hypothetical protein AB4Y81_03060 [Paenarthrobacter sp. TAF1]|uniref:hypothetical protein n=1 Tax=Paenarthrobacter sp. TAF1 TaxID=3233067 RepID=UPI003F994550
MTQTHSLAQYLDVLSETSPNNGPFLAEGLGEAQAATVNAAFAELAHAAVAFVNTAEPIVGYTDVRRMLEDFVHTFPATKEPNPFAMIAALFGITPEEMEAIAAETGEDDGAL